MVKSKENEETINEKDDSWYNIYIVWILTVLGLISMMFGNIYFKIIGLVTVIMGLGVLMQIAKRRSKQNGRFK